MTLASLFDGLCDILSDDHSIERNAKAELRRLKAQIGPLGKSSRLKEPFLDVMARDDAHPICSLIGEASLSLGATGDVLGPALQGPQPFQGSCRIAGADGTCDFIKDPFWACTACCRIPNTEFARTPQRKPTSCWPEARSGRLMTRPLASFLPGRDHIIRQWCRTPPGPVMTPSCRSTSGTAISRRKNTGISGFPTTDHPKFRTLVQHHMGPRRAPAGSDRWTARPILSA